MKVWITALLLSVFSISYAQHSFGFKGEVGGAFRVLRSDYPFLNAMYDQHEMTRFAGSLGLEYSYKLSPSWLLRGGVAVQTKGYRTNTTDGYLGELNSDDVFLEPDEISRIDHDFLRLQVDAGVSYIIKSADTWHVLAGLGPTLNVSLLHKVKTDIANDANKHTPDAYGQLNKVIPGVQAHFGWMNELTNGNDLLFLIRYDQDLQPALSAPIKRYLFAFNFGFYYMMKV